MRLLGYRLARNLILLLSNKLNKLLTHSPPLRIFEFLDFIKGFQDLRKQKEKPLFSSPFLIPSQSSQSFQGIKVLARAK